MANTLLIRGNSLDSSNSTQLHRRIHRNRILYYIHLKGIFELINMEVPKSKVDLNATPKIPF